MSYIGRIKNGVVVIQGPTPLPEGAEVEIIPRAERENGSAKTSLSLYERLKPIIGTAKGLPADAARNVDHYLYGMPKK